MKKKFQKFLALFAVLAVLLAALPVLPVSALNTSTDFQYEVLSEQDKTCALVSYQGFDAVLEIPSQIDGYTVTTIRGGCFAGYASYMLEELTIPDSVTTLDDGALQSCFSLRSVRLPETLEKIGAHVFESCTAMESIEIPASVTTIGSNAFASCPSLTEITIPASVTLIDPTAFSLSDNVVVYGVVNSYTEFFSSSAGLRFQPARSEFLSDYVQYDETDGYAFGFTPGAPLADAFTVTYGGILTLTPNEAGFENGTGALMQMKNSGGQLLSEYTVLIFGDVNGDGAIDAFDAALLQLQLGNAAELTGAYAKAGDLNGDGALSAADYAQVHAQLEGTADISQTPAL